MAAPPRARKRPDEGPSAALRPAAGVDVAFGRTAVVPAGPKTGGGGVADGVFVGPGVNVAVFVGVRVTVAVRVAVAVPVSVGSGVGGIGLGTGAQMVVCGTGLDGVPTVASVSGVMVGVGVTVGARVGAVFVGFGVALGVLVFGNCRVAVGLSVAVGAHVAVWPSQ